MSEHASEAASAVSCIPLFVAGRPDVTEKRCEQRDFVKLVAFEFFVELFVLKSS
jgi:hypothetical protein